MPMRHDVECPFCHHPYDVDEPIMGEDDVQQVECRECEKTFEVVANITVNYSSRCMDNEHDLIPNDKHAGWSDCARCGAFVHKA